VLRIQIPEREIYPAVNVPHGIFIKRIFGTDSRNYRIRNRIVNANAEYSVESVSTSKWRKNGIRQVLMIIIIVMNTCFICWLGEYSSPKITANKTQSNVASVYARKQRWYTVMGGEVFKCERQAIGTPEVQQRIKTSVGLDTFWYFKSFKDHQKLASFTVAAVQWVPNLN